VKIRRSKNDYNFLLKNAPKKTAIPVNVEMDWIRDGGNMLLIPEEEMKNVIISYVITSATIPAINPINALFMKLIVARRDTFWKYN